MKSTLLLILLLSYSVFAEQSKTLEQTYNVKPGQKIILEDLSGAKLIVKSWDKDQAYIKLRVKYSSSDKDFEKEFIKSVTLKESSDDTELRITYDQTDNEGGGWSFLGIKFRFNYYQKKEITGELYIPQKNNFQTDLRYGELTVSNLGGETELYGRSNKLSVSNCRNLKVIENDYGNTEIQNSAGHLLLKNRSNNTDIKNFNGPLKIEADYSNLSIDDIGGKLIVESRSGTHNISNIKGDLNLNSHYSNITCENIGGFADIIARSGSVRVDKAAGVNINGDYCNIRVKAISGKTDRSMKITGRSGSVDIEELTGSIFIDNPYSGMDLRDIRGNVTITGRSASIRANRITGNWRSNTEYMSVNIRELSAKTIEITNRSNPVKLDLRSVPSDVNIKNEYGGVEIDMPQGFSGDVDVSVAYGEIETNLPVRFKKLGSSGYAAGRIGSGSGKLYIEARSGNVEVFERGGNTSSRN